MEITIHEFLICTIFFIYVDHLYCVNFKELVDNRSPCKHSMATFLEHQAVSRNCMSEHYTGC